MPVNSTHPDYDRFAPKWQRCRDVIAGQDAIHAAKEAYLPKLTSETAPSYAARLKRSDFFNGTWRTIAGLGGMAFRKPPTVGVPTAVEKYLEDINLAGVSIEGLARDVLDDVLGVGRIGLLVDHPPIEKDDEGKVVAISKAVAEQRGLRPTIQTYPTESIINWKFARVANSWRLVMVVLKESADVGADEFARETEERWRVLDLGSGAYRQRVFRKADKKGKTGDEFEQVGEDQFPLMNGERLNFIPFAILGADGLGDQIDEPPLIDLVDKNIAHYQVNSDYRHGAHKTALPTLFLSGVDVEKGEAIYIGGDAAVTSTHPDARGEYIEYRGQGLSAIEKMLDRLERQMALLGARMIADESAQAETLGATQIKRQGENSVLARIVQSTSAGLEWALRIFAEWAGETGEVIYQINRDFIPAGMDAQQLNALITAVQAGEMSSESFFDLLQRADLVAPEVTYEEERERIDSKALPRPAKPVAKGEEEGEAA